MAEFKNRDIKGEVSTLKNKWEGLKQRNLYSIHFM